MKKTTGSSRRSFLAMVATAPLASLLPAKKSIPVGIELYSVREQLKENLFGTVQAVARMGYEGVEFYAPYFEWTPEYAKEVRKLLDGRGIRCYSTHNDHTYLLPENLPHAIELNTLLGSRYIVMASAGQVQGLDDWKAVADRLNQAALAMKPAGLKAGYHNHKVEFVPVGGTFPMEVLAKNTDESIMLQLDVGTCLEAGHDPVSWIRRNPKRINCVHCKDWAPGEGKGYRVLFGEGAAPWKEIFQAAEDSGGVEYYLIEQEESGYPAMEAAQRCLAAYRKLRLY